MHMLISCNTSLGRLGIWASGKILHSFQLKPNPFQSDLKTRHEPNFYFKETSRMHFFPDSRTLKFAQTWATRKSIITYLQSRKKGAKKE